MRRTRTKDHLPNGSDSVSSALLVGLRENRPFAWERLVRLYTPTIFSWCRRSGVSSADAEDLVQDVFGAVAKSIKRFRRERPEDSFYGWLAAITRNKVRDFYRRNKKHPQATGGTDHLLQLHSTPDGLATEIFDTSDDGRAGLIQRAADMMRCEFVETTWEAFRLTATEGVAPAEAAERLGISINAVYKARSRVLRRLREEFDGLF